MIDEDFMKSNHDGSLLFVGSMYSVMEVARVEVAMATRRNEEHG